MAADSYLSAKEILNAELDRHLSAILAYDNLCLNNLKKTQELEASNKSATSLKIFNNITNEIAIISQIRQEIFFNRIKQANLEKAREATLNLEKMLRQIAIQNENIAIDEEQVSAKKALQQAIEKEYFIQLQKIKEQEAKYEIKIKECDEKIIKITNVIEKLDKKSDKVLQQIFSDIANKQVIKDFKVGNHDLTYEENELAYRAGNFFRGKIEAGLIDSNKLEADLEKIAKEYLLEVLTNNNLRIADLPPKDLQIMIENAVISLKSQMKDNKSFNEYDKIVSNRIACSIQLNTLKQLKSSLEVGLAELRIIKEKINNQQDSSNDNDLGSLINASEQTALELADNEDFFNSVDSFHFEIPDLNFAENIVSDSQNSENNFLSPPGGPDITDQNIISPPGGPVVDNSFYTADAENFKPKSSTASVFKTFSVKTAKSDESVLEEEKAKQSTPTPSERALDSKKPKQESITNVQTPEREEPASPRMRR